MNKGVNLSMEETLYKNITANDFMNIDFKNVTLVDLREPDEVLVSGIEGAINMPFSSFPKGIDDIPKDKPVYVYCREGNFSEELADILADRGYDVYNFTGGYKEYRKLITGEEINGKLEVVNKTISNSEEVYIDAKNLRCPGPIVKVADTIRNLPDGSTVKVEATEDAFYSDIRVWCERTGNKLLSLDASDGLITAKILKETIKEKDEKNIDIATGMIQFIDLDFIF